ncbi:Zn-ribbon domain-containing OB-fold protein [Sciscionella marina]|uniref:Zn-ribbon domain-containing OB-fold protein n=1 Tax=Sciscionella marina TaxID=508770 RepID=UPI00037C3082|nr:OB-fold domain-containing protein [Sciscionella marina]
MNANKVIPEPDDLNLELFQAIVSSGHLCIQKCRNCGHYSHPPRMYCPRCFSGDYSYERVSGTGTVYSYTLSQHSAEPAWKDELPFLTVVVELDQGPRVVGAAKIDEPTAVRLGQRVRVVPETRTDDFAYLTVVFESEQAS